VQNDSKDEAMKHITHVTSSLVLGKPFTRAHRFRDQSHTGERDGNAPAFIERFIATDDLTIQGIQFMTIESSSTLGSHLWESMPDLKILAEDEHGFPVCNVAVSTGWSFGSKEKTGIMREGLCDYYLNTTVFDSPFCLVKKKAYWLGFYLPLQLELQVYYDAFPNPGNVAAAIEEDGRQDSMGLMSVCGAAFDITMVAENLGEVKRRTEAGHRLSSSSTGLSVPAAWRRLPR
jgi:hypothetical protein